MISLAAMEKPDMMPSRMANVLMLPSMTAAAMTGPKKCMRPSMKWQLMWILFI